MSAETALQINHSHCRAICDEIGERLREVLDRQATALPPRLQVLMLRLAAQDLAGSPSIASINDVRDAMARDIAEPVLAA